MTEPKPKKQAPAFEKEVVRLPDGRELTYYRFPEPAPQPAAGMGPRPSAAGEER